jgi:1-acyl-sn-glycerol-3-phosphate acyltransferase
MLYWIGCAIFKLLFCATGGISVTGTENIPKSGGVIFAPNHISFTDPPVVGCCCPGRQVHFMAKEELFKPPILGAMIRGVGTFPVRRGSADRRALKHAIGLLQSGKVVCIFPEGTRSLDGKLGKAVAGIGLIALKSKAPVVPVAITGTDGVLPPHAKRLYRKHIKVSFGKPLFFTDLYESADSREAVKEVGSRIMEAVSILRNGISPQA